MHVVVVGSGIAGLTTAIRASARHDVTLVTKGALSDSATAAAQGGVAVALGADDAPARHVADTHRAGGGSTAAHAVDVLCSDGPARVRDLVALGVPFDRTTDAASLALHGDDLARGREAAHDRWRVLHADGDATGNAIERTLIAALRRQHVTILERTFLVDLVVRDGAVTGVELLDLLGDPTRLDADAVVLASGGAGHLYRTTTNPLVATGDGQAAALRAGAVLADVEFVQFHPTKLDAPGGGLVSEAVRGEGAVLRDVTGRRFMLAVHEAAELAPRDVVARAIASASRETGAQVFLDATALERENPGFLAARFPGLSVATAAAGFDWRTEAIPVRPAAHYAMGGVATDAEGRTSLPGLFAVGEVACTGVHGANRLASNSLLEGLVFGVRAADAIAAPRPPAVPFRGAATTTVLAASERDERGTAGPAAIDRSAIDRAAIDRAAIDRAPIIRSMIDDAADGDVAESALDRTALQDVMERHVGLLRDEDGLRAAGLGLDRLDAPEANGRRGSAGERRPAGICASVADHEDRNLADLARLVVRAAAARTESRGSHARLDHPDTDPAQAEPLAWRQVVHERIPA